MIVPKKEIQEVLGYSKKIQGNQHIHTQTEQKLRNAKTHECQVIPHIGVFYH